MDKKKRFIPAAIQKEGLSLGMNIDNSSLLFKLQP